ncbi:MAG: hypothetical protein QOH35_2419 [Acidobacteriaceae bacterium]|nr:hypothetical protein [Acidobacteriaceae bacterium]
METTRVPCTLDYTSEETGLAGGSCLHKLLLDGAEDRVAAHTIQPSIAFLIVRTILWREMGAISNEIECPLSLNACQLLSRWTGVRRCHQIRCYLRPGGRDRPVWAYLSIERLPVKLQMQSKAFVRK